MKPYFCSLMDSLVVYRYLIKKYVNQAKKLFKLESIDITTNLGQACNFEDETNIFHDSKLCLLIIYLFQCNKCIKKLL